MKAVTLLSGGLDSVTLAYHLKDLKYNLHALSFDYGQRHKKELDTARRFARDLEAEHHIVSLGVWGDDYDSRYGSSSLFPLNHLLGGSALTDKEIEVPDGHYAEESMRATVVPNRNAIMLSIAYGVAVAEKADLVTFAAHAGDHAIYPDCRPEFVEALEHALHLGNAWDGVTMTPQIGAPFIRMGKWEIARRAKDLGVAIHYTWSCYKGGDIHCGTCGTCYERREALRQAGVHDPTTYFDSTTEYPVPEAR